MTWYKKILATPAGGLTLLASEKGLAAILWQTESEKRLPLAKITFQPDYPLLLEAERQLMGYFQGELTVFTLPIDVTGTVFQKKVWSALATIPYGETRSYQQIANQIGHPAAMRAVGAANGKNPLSIIVPCHRVIGANGWLTGYAGGVAIKSFLLSLETGKQYLK